MASFHFVGVAIRNNAMNLRVKVFVWASVFKSLRYTPINALAGSQSNMLRFLREIKLFLKVVLLKTSLIRQIREFQGFIPPKK